MIWMIPLIENEQEGSQVWDRSWRRTSEEDAIIGKRDVLRAGHR